MSNMKKVLIVDDNQTNLRILEELLAGDYRLQFANNGVEALRIASDFQPSIIFAGRYDAQDGRPNGVPTASAITRAPGLRDYYDVGQGDALRASCGD